MTQVTTITETDALLADLGEYGDVLIRTGTHKVYAWVLPRQQTPMSNVPLPRAYGEGSTPTEALRDLYDQVVAE